jgi:hypothetical protein
MDIMRRRLKAMLAFAGLPLIAVAPWLWMSGPRLLLAVVPLIAIWAVWLVIEYLRWARTLGRR